MLLVRPRDGLSMSNEIVAGAGRGGGGAYAFNSHRDALYKILESAVRGKTSENENHDSSCRIPRCDVEQALSYPTPILWYEDMRPADLDAYHAANRPTRSCSGVDNRSSDDATIRSKQAGGSFNRPKEAGRDDAVAVEERTTVVGGRGNAPPKPTPHVLFSNGTHTSGPAAAAAAAEEDTLRKDVMKQPPILCFRSSNNLRDGCVDEAATSNRPLYGTTSMQQAGAEEPSTSTAAAGADVDNECSSKPCEDASRYPFVMTPTTPPPEPSQATQTMFLPGLPSQVLMTQQRGDVEAWEHAEADGLSQQEEEYLPASLSSPVRGDALIGADLESAGSSASFSTRSRPDRNGSGRDTDGGDKGEAGKAAAMAVARDREASRSRQNEDFTRALRELVGRERPSGASIESGCRQSAAQNRGFGNISSCDRPGQPPFTFVPTEEVLPSGWSGGHVEAVAFLDSHLLHARKRAPGGYAVRALELACHVLRQPAVCVKTMGRSAGTSVLSAVRHVDEDHSEVVGVAGFVWELLREGAKDSGRKPAPATSQE